MQGIMQYQELDVNTSKHLRLGRRNSYSVIRVGMSLRVNNKVRVRSKLNVRVRLGYRFELILLT